MQHEKFIQESDNNGKEVTQESADAEILINIEQKQWERNILEFGGGLFKLL